MILISVADKLMHSIVHTHNIDKLSPSNVYHCLSSDDVHVHIYEVGLYH